MWSPTRYLHGAAALAAVTERLGLTGTINSTFNEPTRWLGSSPRWTICPVAVPPGMSSLLGRVYGENFRRADPGRRPAYERARLPPDDGGAVRLVARRRDRGGQGDASSCPTERGVYAQRCHFDIHGRSTSEEPQAARVFQAGDSDEGRDFAAAGADASFQTQHWQPGRRFTRRQGRLARYGRHRTSCSPARTFVIGDTDAEAEDIARRALAQVSPDSDQFLEHCEPRPVDHDPDGPLRRGPVVGENTISRSRQRRMFGTRSRRNEWRPRLRRKT